MVPVSNTRPWSTPRIRGSDWERCAHAKESPAPPSLALGPPREFGAANGSETAEKDIILCKKHREGVKTGSRNLAPQSSARECSNHALRRRSWGWGKEMVASLNGRGTPLIPTCHHLAAISFPRGNEGVPEIPLGFPRGGKLVSQGSPRGETMGFSCLLSLAHF